MFGSRNDEKRSAAIRSIKAAARRLFEAHDDDAVVVNELRCTEPGCPPVETVVALLPAGEVLRQIKLRKPAAEVSEEDLLAAIQPRDAHPCGRDLPAAQGKLPLGD